MGSSKPQEEPAAGTGLWFEPGFEAAARLLLYIHQDVSGQFEFPLAELEPHLRRLRIDFN